MKTFLISISSLFFCAILLCFLAYATGNFPMPKTTQDTPVATKPQQSGTQKTTVEEDPLCSPCAERIASLLEIMEQEREADIITFLEQPAPPLDRKARGWEWLSPEQRGKAKQLIDEYGTEEGLRRLREMDPEAARQFERGHPPQFPREQGEGSRTVPDGGQLESGSKN